MIMTNVHIIISKCKIEKINQLVSLATLTLSLAVPGIAHKLGINFMWFCYKPL